MVEWINVTRPTEFSSRHIQRGSHGCERMYRNNKCHNHTATESINVNYDESECVVFWKCDRKYRFNGKRRYRNLHVFMEYRRNNTGHHRLNCWNLYSNGNGCKCMYSNNNCNDHTTTSAVGINDKSGERVVLWQ